jgi:hypothetical protein
VITGEGRPGGSYRRRGGKEISGQEYRRLGDIKNRRRGGQAFL